MYNKTHNCMVILILIYMIHVDANYNRMLHGVLLKKLDKKLIYDERYAVLSFVINLPNITIYEERMSNLSLDCNSIVDENGDISEYINKINFPPFKIIQFHYGSKHLYEVDSGVVTGDNIESEEIIPDNQTTSEKITRDPLELKKMIRHLYNFCNILQNIVASETYSWNSIHKEFENVLNDTKNLILYKDESDNRITRSIRDAISSGFQYLFGTARSSDLEKIKTIIDSQVQGLDVIQSNQLKIKNQVNILSKQISFEHQEQTRRLRNITDFIKTSHEYFEEMHHKELRHIHDIKKQQFWQEMIRNDAQSLILKSLNYVRMQYYLENQCLLDMRKLETALFALINNEVPVSYVPTSQMIRALKDLNKKLKTDRTASEIIKLPIDYYYSSGLSLNIIANNKMFISTHIPTKKSEEGTSFLEIFKVIVLEIPINNDNKVVTKIKRMPAFIGVDKERKYMVKLTESDMIACINIKNHYYHCNRPIEPIKGCVKALLEDNALQITNSCSYELTQSGAFEDIHSLEQEVIFTKHTDEFFLECYSNKENENLKIPNENYTLVKSTNIQNNTENENFTQLNSTNIQNNTENNFDNKTINNRYIHNYREHINKCEAICSIYIPCNCVLKSEYFKLPQHKARCENYTHNIEIFHAMNLALLNQYPDTLLQPIYTKGDLNKLNIMEIQDEMKQLDLSKLDHIIKDFKYQNVPSIDASWELEKLKNVHFLDPKYYTKQTLDSYNFLGTSTLIFIVTLIIVIIFREKIAYTICQYQDKRGTYKVKE